MRLLFLCTMVLVALSVQAEQESEVSLQRGAREAGAHPSSLMKKLKKVKNQKKKGRKNKKNQGNKKKTKKGNKNRKNQGNKSQKTKGNKRRNRGRKQPPQGRAAIKGNNCEYIFLADITSNSGCTTGNKFVIKGATGVRKQFLILNSKTTLAFVTKGAKFTACTTFTDITTTVTCKEVTGLASVDLGSSGSAAATTEATAGATTAAAGATTLAPVDMTAGATTLAPVDMTATFGATTAAAGATTAAAGATTAAGTCKCGIKKTSRIVGGNESGVNEYPWIAIFASADGTNQGGCASTLIANNWAVTASHCLKDENGAIQTTSTMSVVLGIHDRTVTTDTLRKVIPVAEIITHPAYNTDNSQNDIALLRLGESVDLTAYSPACLPAQGADFAGKNGWVYGWGVLSDGGQVLAQKLQELEVPIVSDATCSAAMGPQGVTITADMLCAGGVEGKDGCQGDSGGPLTVDVDGKHTLVGDVSFGLGCAKAGLYGVYAETAQFRTWIDETIAAKGGATFCT